MLLNSTELEMLKLCALGRFMPCSVAGKYDLPELRESMLNSFVRNGYLKIVKGEQRCYRLTRRGRDILYNAGYTYPDDSRPRREGAIFKRRVINAEINALFHSAGIDVYTGTVEELSKAECVYISSLTIRSQARSKVLAGTRFYGILRIRDTAFVVYYVDDEQNAIFPNYEEQTFLNIISGIDDIKHIAVMMVCKDLKEITEIVYPDIITKLNGGYASFAELMNKWKYDFYIVPLNRDGQLQMRVCTVEGLGESIAERFGRKETNCYDAVSEGRAFIIATDMNVTRIQKGLEQTIYDGYTPHIICMPYQRAVYQEMAVRMKYPKMMKFTVLNKNKLTEQFPKLTSVKENIKPATDVNGKYIDIGVERG